MKFPHPDPIYASDLRSALAAWFPRGSVRWRAATRALDRDDLPILPRGCMFLTLADTFDPLVQDG
ncbi:hypothetical protein H9643_22360 [Ochrobactrum sp. Sa2BUA5]|nr:hypothetical protein [Ochrobactrum gallinarum]